MRGVIKVEEIIENDKLAYECRDFYEHIHLMKEFGNYCTVKTFVYLFGEEEGNRLWLCFVEDAGRNIYKLFFEYLNYEQMFVIVANILKNRDLRMVSFV